MNKPLDRGTAVGAKRFSRWLSQFSGYRNPVTNHMIELWLEQFSAKDQDLAARILDAVLFVGHQSIRTCFREQLGSLDGWNQAKSKRQGRWFFVPFSGSIGESGDSMVHLFRMATSMTKKRYNELFIHRSELPAKKPGPDDTVVLLDDFSGSGKQACDAWREFFAELLTEGPRVVLMLVAATQDALERIANETEMEPICCVALNSRDKILGKDCTYFTDAEKRTLLEYCKSADPKRPRGFGDSGLVVVFAHNCPNNSISILHAANNDWQALFPRHD
jgi:hypothetical protein